MSETPTRVDRWLKVAQSLSIIAGIAVSVVTYWSTREKESLTRRIEAQAPFLKLRQQRYVEIGEVVAKLVSNAPESEDYKKAKTRFRELYIVELTMVESPEVASQMVKLARFVDPKLLELQPQERIALDLAGALQRSFSSDLGMQDVPVQTKRQSGESE